MSDRCISKECLGTTGFSYTLSLINGKYKMTILYTLMEFGVVRFNEMKKYIGDIYDIGDVKPETEKKRRGRRKKSEIEAEQKEN